MERIKQLLGVRIKKLRRLRGLTQEELAELVGVSVRSLSHIECGESFPSKSLYKLATALDVSIGEFLDVEDYVLTRRDMEDFLVNYIQNLPDENLAKLYKVIRSLC